MRKIKFRALPLAFENDRGISPDFVYGDVHFGKENKSAHIHPKKGSHRSVQVDVETIGQFTGLLDRHGVEIYEGDVIKNKWFNVNKKDIGQEMVVKFGEHETSPDYYASSAYGWYVEGDVEIYSMAQIPTDSSRGLEDIEIIGNIHNKEKP